MGRWESHCLAPDNLANEVGASRRDHAWLPSTKEGWIVPTNVLVQRVVLGGALGRSIREFRKEKEKGEELPQSTESRSERTVAQLEAGTGKERFCPSCGDRMTGSAKFRMGCGAKAENYAT